VGGFVRERFDHVSTVNRGVTIVNVADLAPILAPSCDNWKVSDVLP